MDSSVTTSAPSPDKYAWVSLVIFLLTIGTVIYPIKIPLPTSRLYRFTAHHRWIPTHLPLNLAVTPPLAVFLLWAIGATNSNTIKTGLVGAMGVQPYAVLILFYSLAYLCVSLDMTGIYQFLAFAIAKKANGRGTLAFTLFFALTSILSGLTSNDVVILTGTSFLAYFTRVSGVLPTAFMMSEFISANIASMALFIGNPTNVIVSTAFDITFASYSAWMMLPTIGGLVVAYVVLRVVYRKAEYIPPTILRPDDDIEPASFLVDRRGATVGTLLLLTCLGTLIGTSFVKGVSVWMVTLPFAVLALVRDIWYDYCAAHQRLPTATVVVTTANTMVTTATMGSTATTVMDVVDKGTRENESPEPILLEKIAAATSLTPLPSPAPSPPPFPPSPSTSTSPPLVRTSQVPRLMMLETNQDHVLLAGLHELETSDDRDRKKSDSLPDEEELDLGTHSDSYPNEIRASGVPPITPSTAVAQTMDPHRASLATNLPIRTYRSVTLAVLRRLPWTVLPFSLGMFVLVEVLTDVQWTRIFAAGLVELTANAYGAVFGFMALTVLLCQFINNLPATILLTRIIQDEAFQSRLQQSPITQQAVLLAIIAGSNIGACLTLVGSLAGIMFEHILRTKGIYTLGYGSFLKWNLLILPMIFIGIGSIIVLELYVIFK